MRVKGKQGASVQLKSLDLAPTRHKKGYGPSNLYLESDSR